MRISAAIILALAIVASAGSQVRAQPAAVGALPAAGSEFPAFTLPGVDGKPVSLDDFRGKAILLSFWSCYTDTCYASVPVIADLLKEHASRGLVAPTVCSEVPPALAKEGYTGLLQRCGTGQVIMIDDRMKLARKLGIVEFPTTFLIDRKHAVWQVVTGVRPLLGEDFRALVSSLVAE